jgi:precorrin-8X/cobalt-precorrin-8 methylmutase
MILDPNEIEKRSFEIITQELGHLKIDEKYQAIIKRVIHTTADFEYGRIIQIHNKAIENGINALKKGIRIYTDTKMIIAGVNKKKLEKLNCEIYSYIDDETVGETAKQKNLTRSIVGIEKAFADKKTKIYVIGNAPTALVRLKELIEKENKKPDLIIGVPVGFVGAEESKEEIKKLDIPYIVTNGRKGGSTVAVAILNAILYQIE